MSALPSPPTRGALAAPVRQMLLLLERLHKQLTSRIDQVLLPEELSLAEWLIVSELSMAGESSLSSIALRLSRDAGSLSRAINRLSQRKLLESRRNGYDRRRATLTLTTQGRVLHERVACAFERMVWAQPASEAHHIGRLLSHFGVNARPTAAIRATASNAPDRTTPPQHGSHVPTQKNDSLKRPR